MSDRANPGVGGTVDVGALLDAIGPWAEGAGPLFRRLARAVAAAVDRGALPHGTRLPSERDLARGLAVGRGTAVAAMDVLVADGLVVRRRGSGTYVTVPVDGPRLPADREGTALVHRLVAAAGTGTPGVGWAVDAPTGPGSGRDVVDLSLSVLWARRGPVLPALDGDALVAAGSGPGYQPAGLPSLRAAVAAHLGARGLPTVAEQVVATTGAQQAISLAAACWVRPGDVVVVDDPTYPGAIAAFAQAGARVVGAPVDGDGVVVEAVAERLDPRPALVYVQSLHSPTGAVLAPRRRRALVELVAGAGIPLVEDATLADLGWTPAPVPVAAQDGADGAPVVHVGSLSKSTWSGLRVGWLRAPEPLALRLARIKATRDLGSALPSQVLAERLLAAWPAQPEHVRLATDLRDRHDHLAARLAEALPTWTWDPPAGGLSLWVRLPGGADAGSFAQHALRHGVAVAPPGPLTAGDGHHDRVRLSFAAPPEVLDVAVDRLARAWVRWPGSGS